MLTCTSRTALRFNFRCLCIYTRTQIQAHCALISQATMPHALYLRLSVLLLLLAAVTSAVGDDTDHCEEYDESGTSCKLCKDGFVNHNGKCLQDCDAWYCVSCPQHPSKCEACDYKYHLDGDRCESNCKDENCVDCPDDVTVCTMCAVGFNIDATGICVFEKPCHDPFCYDCTQSGDTEVCNICIGHYTPKNGMCVEECHDPYCETCRMKRNVCEKCVPGFSLKNDQCYADCADRHCRACATDKNVCTKCIDGYKASETGKCEIHTDCKDKYCLKCDGQNKEHCTQCVEGYVMNADKCTLACSVDKCEVCAHSNADTCVLCEPDYVVVDGKCVKCNRDHCKSCKPGHADQCWECESGYSLNSQGNCNLCNVNDCDVCIFGKADQCFRCREGFTVKNHVCKKDDTCPLNFCVNCDNKKKCTACEAGYTRTDYGICTLPCHVDHCSVCRDGRSDVCETCNPTYTEKDGACLGNDGGVAYLHIAPAALTVLIASAIVV